MAKSDDRSPSARTHPPKSASALSEKKDQDLIGKNLRAVYDPVAAEPLPDRFRELLEKLKKGEVDG